MEHMAHIIWSKGSSQTLNISAKKSDRESEHIRNVSSNEKCFLSQLWWVKTQFGDLQIEYSFLLFIALWVRVQIQLWPVHKMTDLKWHKKWLTNLNLASSVRTQMITRGYFQAYSCWKMLEISGTVYIFHLTDTPKNQN